MSRKFGEDPARGRRASEPFAPGEQQEGRSNRLEYSARAVNNIDPRFGTTYRRVVPYVRRQYSRGDGKTRKKMHDPSNHQPKTITGPLGRNGNMALHVGSTLQ